MKKIIVIFSSLVALVATIALVYTNTELGYGRLTQPKTTQPNNSLEILELLENLPSFEYSPLIPTYERAQFGQRWSDDVTVEYGHNGCDTRNDILKRDLREVTYKPETRDCVVQSGILDDVYTGETIYFQLGNDTSALVPIDHIVALAQAWYFGAYAWDEDKRRNFANDPLNLQATTESANKAKSAHTVEQWLPITEYQCTFAQRVVTVKSSYTLAVTELEREILREVLQNCSV